MTGKNAKITYQAVLEGRYGVLDEMSKELLAELKSDLHALFEKFSGYELASATVDRIRRFAIENANHVVGDLQNIDENELERIQETIYLFLIVLIKKFISDEHRNFVVRRHARGITTAEAVQELMEENATMGRFAQDDALGEKQLRETLTHRMSYLKPGTARWPEKKYGTVWREEREKYKHAIVNLPFTSEVEQIALLAKHAVHINSVLGKNEYTVKDMEMLTNSLTKTLGTLQKLTAVEQPPSENLSGAQLVAVLERLTVALDTPDQLALSGDTDALVSVLEQLTLALKTSGQKVLGEESVQDAEVVSAEDSDSLQ